MSLGLFFPQAFKWESRWSNLYMHGCTELLLFLKANQTALFRVAPYYCSIRQTCGTHLIERKIISSVSAFFLVRNTNKVRSNITPPCHMHLINQTKEDIWVSCRASVDLIMLYVRNPSAVGCGDTHYSRSELYWYCYLMIL